MSGKTRKMLGGDLTRDRHTLKIINDFAVELIAIPTKGELAWYVAREVVGNLGFIDCVIYYVDINSKVLKQWAAIGESKNPSSKTIIDPLEIPFGQGITGHVAQTKTPLIVDDLIKDNRYIADVDAARSEICVPLLIEDRVVGVIDCEDPNIAEFDEGDLELLTTIASLTSAKLKLISQEEELLNKTQMLQQAEEISLLGHWKWNIAGERLEFCSDQLAQLFGYTAPELIERLTSREAFLEFIHPDDRAFVDTQKRSYSRASQEKPTQKSSLNIEYRVLRRDGITIYVREIVGNIVDKNGDLVRSVGTIQNITEQKEAEDATQSLRKVEQQYQVVVEDLTEMISRHAPDGTRTFVNKAYCEMQGKNIEQLIGGSVYEGLSTDDLKKLKDVYKTLTPESPTSEFENSFLKPDGQRVWQLWTKRAIFNEDRQVTEYQSVGRDVSQQKKAEESVIASREEAELASRSKSDFLANMSHELRTPLNAIIGFSDMMKHEIFGSIEPLQYKDYINDIHDSGNHLHALINKVLDMSKIEAGEYKVFVEDVILRTIIKEVMAMVKVQADKKKIKLLTELPTDIQQAKADRLVTKQVLINLLTNAIKFTPEGGSVTAQVSFANDMAVVEVIDTGIGLSVENIERSLKPFIQIDRGIKSAHEGTGLGLTLCKSFVELQGGTFTLSSPKGGGTIATFTLPLSSQYSLIAQ